MCLPADNPVCAIGRNVLFRAVQGLHTHGTADKTKPLWLGPQPDYNNRKFLPHTQSLVRHCVRIHNMCLPPWWQPAVHTSAWQVCYSPYSMQAAEHTITTPAWHTGTVVIECMQSCNPACWTPHYTLEEENHVCIPGCSGQYQTVHVMGWHCSTHCRPFLSVDPWLHQVAC